MKRSFLRLVVGAAIALAGAVLCCSCTYTLKLKDPPKFNPVRLAGVTFTPSVKHGDGPAVLRIRTTRPSPVTEDIDTIAMADITVTAGDVVHQQSGLVEPVSIALSQVGNDDVLLEAGDLILTGDLQADLPTDTPHKAFDVVTVSYKGESAVTYLQQPAN